MTAMDYRQYDNALGKFNSVDALAELIPGITPYHFGFNNPVCWSDPTGLFPDSVGTSNGQEYKDSDGSWIWDGSSWIGQDGTASIHDMAIADANPIMSGGGDAKKKDIQKNITQKTISGNGEILVGNIKSSETKILGYIKGLNIENNTIIWISHGSYNGINGGMLASEFHEFLMANSALYKNRFDNKQPVILKLFSCNTGQPDAGSLASNLSQINKKAIIWAPTSLVGFTPKWHNMDYEASVQNDGYFNIFTNGEVINTGNFKK